MSGNSVCFERIVCGPIRGQREGYVLGGRADGKVTTKGYSESLKACSIVLKFAERICPPGSKCMPIESVQIFCTKRNNVRESVPPG